MFLLVSLHIKNLHHNKQSKKEKKLFVSLLPFIGVVNKTPNVLLCYTAKYTFCSYVYIYYQSLNMF
jgi:hypothetical protein